MADGAIALRENETAIIGIEVRRYPGGLQELHGMFAAGDMTGVLELIDETVAAARLAGCDTAAISSFPAWGRILKSRGFVPDQLTITKELSDGAL